MRHGTRFAGLLVLGALALGATSVVRAAEQARVAVVVGNNVGNLAERALRYAESEVGKVAGLLRDSGGFTDLQLVRGASRHDVELALRQARAKLEEARAAGKETLFLFYYSGHGDNEALELGSTRLPLRDLRSYLENLPADVRLAFVDACQSGALTGVKGGKRAPAYEVKLADPGSVRGMAIITSSTANELSQESDELGGSYFSHHIMNGLRGAADVRKDGQVTLSELYLYAFRQTLAHTAATLVGGQHPTYDYQMAGTGDVVLTRTLSKDAQLAFPREKGVTYSVIHNGEVTAELASRPDEDLYLALPAGEYKIVRRELANVKEAKLALAAGTFVAVNPSSMRVVPAEIGMMRKKGGRFEAPTMLGAHAAVVTPVVSGAPSVVGGAGVSLARAVSFGIVRLRGDFASYDATGTFAQLAYVNSQLRVAPSFDLLLPVRDGSRVGVFVGPTVGAPMTWQRSSFEGTTVGEPTFSLGLSYGGLAALVVRVGRGIEVGASLIAGAELQKVREGQTDVVRHQATFGATLGMAYGF